MDLRILIALSALVPALSAADVVTEWNEIAITRAAAAGQNPLVISRTVAMVHTAMFDAVNSIEGRYVSYAVRILARPGSSPEAAALAAAHATLVALLPDQEPELEAAYLASLAQIAEGPGKADGVSLGQRVASEIVRLRTDDGTNAAKPYRPATTPGVYVPTVIPVAPQWGDAKPWVMTRGSQFRPDPPPALTSEQWAKDYNEIKLLGGKRSAARTQEQTEIGRFWIMVGPASWFPIVRQIAEASQRGLLENARLHALIAVATADAYIAVFDAKYAFNFWRPITAIRNGDIDGNDATTVEPAWESLIETPLHPEYPCAHCITSAAVATILNREVGAKAISTVTFTSPTAPGVVRKWASTDEYVEEVSAARIYAGVHYRTSTTVAQEMGRKIAELTLRQRMQPLR